jgi:uncharacterized membrane protein (UPF0127 family)
MTADRSVATKSSGRRGMLFAGGAVIALGVGGWLLASNLASGAGPDTNGDGFPDTITITTDTGVHTFSAEWVVTPSDRQRGLMYRMEMAPDHGMMFDFEREAPVSFWMRNTYISLDMIFIREDGSVLRVGENATPLSDTSIPSTGPVRYVFEVIAGTADRISLDPGDIVDLR